MFCLRPSDGIFIGADDTAAHAADGAGAAAVCKQRVRVMYVLSVLKVVSHLNHGLNSHIYFGIITHFAHEEFSRYLEFYSIYNTCKTESKWVKIATPTAC